METRIGITPAKLANTKCMVSNMNIIGILFTQPKQNLLRVIMKFLFHT
jgi:hypothetical protein